jgi:hypothetical protein
MKYFGEGLFGRNPRLPARRGLLGRAGVEGAEFSKRLIQWEVTKVTSRRSVRQDALVALPHRAGETPGVPFSV